LAHTGPESWWSIASCRSIDHRGPLVVLFSVVNVRCDDA
jgi:hypothetical protein